MSIIPVPGSGSIIPVMSGIIPSSIAGVPITWSNFLLTGGRSSSSSSSIVVGAGAGANTSSIPSTTSPRIPSSLGTGPFPNSCKSDRRRFVGSSRIVGSSSSSSSIVDVIGAGPGAGAIAIASSPLKTSSLGSETSWRSFRPKRAAASTDTEENAQKKHAKKRSSGTRENVVVLRVVVVEVVVFRWGENAAIVVFFMMKVVNALVLILRESWYSVVCSFCIAYLKIFSSSKKISMEKNNPKKKTI